MNDRALHLRVGLMVVVTFLIAVILVLFFGKMPSLKGTYTIRMKFPQAPGVTPDSPVRKSGILIGRVRDVEFADDGGVIVTARIDEGIPLRQNEVCRIKGSLLGDAVLEFVPSGDPSRSDKPIDRQTLQHGVVAAEPLEVMNDFQEQFSKAIDSIVRTSDNLGDTAESVNRMLNQNEGRFNSIVAQADDTLGVVKTTFENVNKMVGDDKSREQIAKAIQQMPELMTETRQVIAHLDEAVGAVDRNLRNMEGITEPLRESGPGLVAKIDRTITKLDGVMDQINTFTQALNNNNGTLGQLVHNRELYDNLNQTAANIEELTRKLRPIVDDARVFSDKIARHPGAIVRDAVKPQVGTKGIPGMSDRAVVPAEVYEPVQSPPRFPLFQPR